MPLLVAIFNFNAIWGQVLLPISNYINSTNNFDALYWNLGAFNEPPLNRICSLFIVTKLCQIFHDSKLIIIFKKKKSYKIVRNKRIFVWNKKKNLNPDTSLGEVWGTIGFVSRKPRVDEIFWKIQSKNVRSLWKTSHLQKHRIRNRETRIVVRYKSGWPEIL